MLFITHPFEGEPPALVQERERFAKFLTAHIQAYFPDEIVFNFPLNWILIRQELGLKTTQEETVRKSIELMAKSDAIIILNFLGRELCHRSQMELQAAHRLDVPTVIFPFYRHRFEQQLKQNALLADQKRVLNLLRANLQNS